jgi:hypothetical protein
LPARGGRRSPQDPAAPPTPAAAVTSGGKAAWGSESAASKEPARGGGHALVVAALLEAVSIAAVASLMALAFDFAGDPARARPFGEVFARVYAAEVICIEGCCALHALIVTAVYSDVPYMAAVGRRLWPSCGALARRFCVGYTAT